MNKSSPPGSRYSETKDDSLGGMMQRSRVVMSRADKWYLHSLSWNVSDADMAGVLLIRCRLAHIYIRTIVLVYETM